MSPIGLLSPSFPFRQLDEIAAQLEDLGQFGIHINNPNGKCFRCGGDTTAKDPSGFRWSVGVHMDARCRNCYMDQSRDGIPATFDTIYTPERVYAIKVEPDRFGRKYDIIVKIDGGLYYGTSYHMSTYALVGIRSGVHVHKAGLQMSDRDVQRWYEDRVLQQAAKTEHTEELAIRWMSQHYPKLDVDLRVDGVPYGRYTWDAQIDRHVPMNLGEYRHTLGSLEALRQYLNLIAHARATLRNLQLETA